MMIKQGAAGNRRVPRTTGMKIFSTFIAPSILLCVLSGCETHYATYDIMLTEAVAPLPKNDINGKQTIYHTDSLGIKKYCFENDFVKIIWSPSAYGVGFTIDNKTDSSVTVLWDDAAYVNEVGSRYHVIHSGIRFINKRDLQSPTVIPKNGTLDDLVFPLDYIYGDMDGGWYEAPLWPDASGSLGKLKSQSRAFFGKSFQVVLPLSVHDVVNEYTFTFFIRSASYK